MFCRLLSHKAYRFAHFIDFPSRNYGFGRSDSREIDRLERKRDTMAYLL